MKRSKFTFYAAGPPLNGFFLVALSLSLAMNICIDSIFILNSSSYNKESLGARMVRANYPSSMIGLCYFTLITLFLNDNSS